MGVKIRDLIETNAHAATKREANVTVGYKNMRYMSCILHEKIPINETDGSTRPTATETNGLLNT